MTKADARDRAARRAAAGRRRGSGSPARRRSQRLARRAWRAFWRHPSPWMIGAFLVGAVAARVARRRRRLVGAADPGRPGRAVPGHRVGHPRRRSCTGGRAGSGRSTVDSLLARKHREHHADPRDLPLVFIPWQVLVWLLPAYVASRCSRCRPRSSALLAAGVGLRAQVRLRVDALPGAQRLPAAVARGTARCGATTGCTTTRTSTTGSPSPPRAPPTGCSAPTPTRRRSRPRRRCGRCTPTRASRAPVGSSSGGISLHTANGSSSSSVSDAAAGGRGRS